MLLALRGLGSLQLWRFLEKKTVLVAYMWVIDMYDRVRTRVRTLVGNTNDFPIDSGPLKFNAKSLSFYHCYTRAH